MNRTNRKQRGPSARTPRRPRLWADCSARPARVEEVGPTPEPQWQPSDFTGLGQTDPVSVSMRYRIPPGGACCGDLGLFVYVDVQVRVPAGAAERTARLQGYVPLPWPAGVDGPGLCTL